MNRRELILSGLILLESSLIAGEYTVTKSYETQKSKKKSEFCTCETCICDPCVCKPALKKQIVLYTTKTCQGCIFVKNELKKETYSKAGWKIGTEVDCHIKVVESREEVERMGIETVPTFVLFESGKEVRRLTPSAQFNAREFILDALEMYGAKRPKATKSSGAPVATCPTCPR